MWGRSGLNRRPTDYEKSRRCRSGPISRCFVLGWRWLSDTRNGRFSNWCATHVPHARGALRGPPTYGVPVSRAAVRTLVRFSCLVAAAWLWLIGSRNRLPCPARCPSLCVSRCFGSPVWQRLRRAVRQRRGGGWRASSSALGCGRRGSGAACRPGAAGQTGSGALGRVARGEEDGGHAGLRFDSRAGGRPTVRERRLPVAGRGVLQRSVHGARAGVADRGCGESGAKSDAEGDRQLRWPGNRSWLCSCPARVEQASWQPVRDASHRRQRARGAGLALTVSPRACAGTQRVMAKASHRPCSGAREPAGVAESRVDAVHHEVTRSALDPARRWADAQAEGRRLKGNVRHDGGMRFSRRPSRSEVVARHAMPGDSASDEEWAAWAAVQEVDSILAGWDSSRGSGPRKSDAEWYARAHEALQTPGVRGLLGPDWERWLSAVEEYSPE